MAADFKLEPSTGLIGGMTVQFAEGSWPGEIGSGIAMTDEAFDVVEPILQAAAPGWTPMHRYGVFELIPSVRMELATNLRSKAAEHRRLQPDTQPQVLVLEELATWLEARPNESQQVSVLGY